MARPRRLVAAVVAGIGLLLAALGTSFALVVGPSGTVAFTATASGPLVLGPGVLNRLDVPATVSARSGAGPVFLGAAAPADAADAVGGAAHEEVVVAQFPARSLRLTTAGSGPLPDPSSFAVWRSTGQDTLVVTQDNAPESVLVYPRSGGPVDVSVTWQRPAWFVEALVLLVLGLVLAALGGGWLWREVRSAAGDGQAEEAAADQGQEAAADQGQEEAAGQDLDEPAEETESEPERSGGSARGAS